MKAREALFSRLTGVTQLSEVERTAELQGLHDSIRDLAAGGTEDLITLFSERLRENGAKVSDCANGKELAGILDGLIGDEDRIVFSGDPRFQELGISQELAQRASRRSISCSDDDNYAASREGWKKRYAELDAGISFAVAGIAESGAILMRTAEDESRAMSLLPLHHIAVVTADSIHRTLTDVAPLIRSLAQRDGSSAVTLIGGPSKTADIEKVLVTGMHGPKKFTVLIVRQMTSDS